MIELDVWFDVVCPWCLIGWRRLERALGDASLPAVAVRHRAFELQPGMPEKGLEARPFYLKKFGTERAMQAAFERVTQIGQNDGIAFAFDKMPRAPNTRLAHRALKIAGLRGVDALFRAHFEDGIDIGDVDAVVSVLAASGADAAELRTRLAEGDALDDVVQDERLASELGITGVPFFLAGQRVALPGAGEVEHLRALILQAAGALPRLP